MTHARATTAKHGIAMILVALAVAAGSLAASSAANAQSTSTPCSICNGVSLPPTGGAPTPPSFTPPTPTYTPPVVTMTPPVVSVTPPRPERPPNFMNVPSDMRSLTQLDSIASMDRLLSSPAVVNLTIPRQAQPNKLENRLPEPVAADAGKDSQGARQALEGAKPLI